MIFDKEWRRNQRIKKVKKDYDQLQQDEKATLANHSKRLLTALEAGDIKAIRFYSNYFDSKGIALPNNLKDFNQWVKDVAR